MDAYKKLLLANKAWVAEKLAIRPDYFERTATTQTPAFMWIGCSDSRVPAESVTSTEPGELFVHRNVANLVVHTDFNMLSVLQYAVEVLEVKHIIICGHYGCGGVRNAMTNRSFGLIDKWLRHIKDVYRAHRRDLETIADPEKRLDRLVEFNVTEQVQNLAETSIVQHAWARYNRPTVHGWVYDLRTGFLKEHALMKPGAPLEDIYRFDFDDVPSKH
ncbi:carbonate dehydratase [Polyangium spumosum]|uniref:Carbonic anhydrase n=1 Tax=Polyangium spumosum TaxID=889282 RepID=A0A6N7PW76_9BACT|nr:carbonate dehydratase [Polyangium spumosum]MRG94690.1 carbonate dehydratase [Polyangium spumosum]